MRSQSRKSSRSLVIYHTRFGTTSGTIRESVAYARRNAAGAKRLVRRSLAEGLGLPNDPVVFVTFRDARTNLEYLRSAREIWERGLRLQLTGGTDLPGLPKRLRLRRRFAARA